MIEIPEALTISNQLNEVIKGKTIMNVFAASSPHKFAWYHKDPQNYHELLSGKMIESVKGFGGFVEIKAEDSYILLNDGVSIKYCCTNEKRPQKHQLLVEFDDFSAISCTVQMYGGLLCFRDGDLDNIYYKMAKEKPMILSDEFSRDYFTEMFSSPEVQKLSAKAFLATEQRIPGLGNGVLQDILYNAKIHPKKKVNTFSDAEKSDIYNSIKATISEMIIQGGRDTEKDIFGCFGGYETRLSKNTAGKSCGLCGSIIKKESYLGGSIYYCEGCQKL
jgi:formamidopyrimidine-DNA glycosylase